jgi:hypothetical protein
LYGCGEEWDRTDGGTMVRRNLWKPGRIYSAAFLAELGISEGSPYEYDTSMAFKHMNISNKETREKKSY